MAFPMLWRAPASSRSFLIKGKFTLTDRDVVAQQFSILHRPSLYSQTQSLCTSSETTGLVKLILLKMVHLWRLRSDHGCVRHAWMLRFIVFSQQAIRCVCVYRLELLCVSMSSKISIVLIPKVENLVCEFLLSQTGLAF